MQSTQCPTHPWITFVLDTHKLRPEIWLLGGEAISKCDHIAGVPLLPHTAAELMQVYLAKGAQATTAIEGNTLTEDEVRRRIEHDLPLPPSKEYLGVEIDNIVRACNAVLDEASSGGAAPLTSEKIAAFNAAVLKGLVVEPHVAPGQFRTYSVGVADYRAVPHTAARPLLDALCEWLNQPWFTGLQNVEREQLNRLDAVFKAVLAHLYIAWIHPFGDGNGRTARLVEFYILVNAGIPFPSAHLLSNHYNQTRSDYYRQLSHASNSQGDVSSFLQYALRGFADQLREQIMAIRLEQQRLFWERQVSYLLGESKTDRRRKHLVLDLALLPEGLAKRDLTSVSARVARAYATLDDKTLTRDVDALLKLGLIDKIDTKFLAKVDMVLAYLPSRAMAKSVAHADARLSRPDGGR